MKINGRGEREAPFMHGDLYILNTKFLLDVLCTWTEGVHSFLDKFSMPNIHLFVDGGSKLLNARIKIKSVRIHVKVLGHLWSRMHTLPLVH